MSRFGGIAQILAMLNAQNTQLATQSAERDASLKLELAKLAQASEEKMKKREKKRREKMRGKEWPEKGKLRCSLSLRKCK